MSSYEVIRIPKHYVGDGCVQVRLQYKNGLVLFNTSKILFLDNLKVEEKPINAYMTDTRRLAFPYFNIPTYKEEHISFIQYHTHQLFDFNRPYISFADGEFKLNYVLKDEDGVLDGEHIYWYSEDYPDPSTQSVERKIYAWKDINGVDFRSTASSRIIATAYSTDNDGKQKYTAKYYNLEKL